MIKGLRVTEYGREGKVYCDLCGSEIGIYIPDEEVTEEYANRCVENMNSLSPKQWTSSAKPQRRIFLSLWN